LTIFLIRQLCSIISSDEVQVLH